MTKNQFWGFGFLVSKAQKTKIFEKCFDKKLRILNTHLKTYVKVRYSRSKINCNKKSSKFDLPKNGFGGPVTPKLKFQNSFNI